MKKNSLITMALLMPLLVFSQQSAVEKLFEKYGGKEGFTTISINRGMFEMLNDMDPEDENLKVLAQITVFSQDCSCYDNLNWLIKTFEENDAGFQYVIDLKGEVAYKKHNEEFIDRVKTINNVGECSRTLYEWTQFFRSGHIGIELLRQEENRKKELTNEEIIEEYKDRENYEISFDTFLEYLSTLKQNPGFEGIWETGNYKIGIIRDLSSEIEKYIGFIIEADGVYWHKNQIKVKIQISKETGMFDAVYYMQDHSEKIFKNVDLLGSNYLKTGFVIWKRIEPKIESDKEIERYLELMETETPILTVLSEETILLRIPSFSYSNKKLIDSLIDANHKMITNYKNFIIDLRNNGGGSDASYQKIIPYLYTNPIRTVGAEMLSTPLNNNRMEDFIADPDWSEEEKDWARKALIKLNENIGEFVNLDSTDVSIETMDTIYANPENIAIIINENNGSTTEQFLIAAKQSKKVKLFGKTTAGVLDISNMYSVEFPCGDIKLWYSLSKSMRIPEMTIDDKGIQPDYYIDKSVPEYKWIEFVNKILKE